MEKNRMLFDHQIYGLQKFGGISRMYVDIRNELNKSDDFTAKFSVKCTNNEYLKNEYENSGCDNLKETIKMLEKGNFDVFYPTYFSTYFLEHLNGKPFIMSVHDMIPELYPQYFRRNDMQIVGKREMVKHASAIEVPTETTKRDLIEILKVDPSKIHVVGRGVSDEFGVNANDRNIVGSKYVFYVGNRDYYKRFDWFIKHSSAFFNKHDDIKLVCTGKIFTTQERNLLSKFNMLDKTISMSVNDDELATLYKNAEFFVFPSEYEGFGLPVLEAYKMNCIALLNDNDCFREITFDKGTFFTLKENESNICDVMENTLLLSENDKEHILCTQRDILSHYSIKKTTDKIKDMAKNVLSNKKNKVSIITINLNNKDGLEKTIKSVVEQTYFDKVNYIMIDGGSTDGSVDVIKQYDDKISHWVSEKDNGVYSAMNKGVDLCKSEYVLFLNSGDYLSSNNVIEEVYDELDGDIVYGNLYVATSRGVYLKKYPKRIKDIYFKNESLPHPGSFIRTECLKKYRYSEKYSIISDWIFFYEGIVNYGLTYKHIETPISVFKLGGLSSNVANVKAEKEKYYNSLKYDCKIGVVIPCYNSEKYIEKTIDSLKKQTFVDWKCVIVNDGSTDNSEEIILKCIDGDKRFSYIKQENQGVPPRNVGIRSLDSKYIFCLDADDIINENYFSKGVEFLDSNPDYSVFYGNAKFLYDDGTTKDWKLPEYSYTRLLRGNIIYCSFLYRRSDYEKTDGYDETMKGFEDWDFLIRLLKNAGKVYKSKSVLFYYRRHDKSLDKTYNRGDNRIKMIDYIFNKNKGIYEENKIKEERLLEPYINKNPKEIITNKMKKLALIIPTKDNSESLLRLLYSIVYHTEYNKANLALYIVDNGSKENEKNKVIEHINRVIKEYGYNIKFYETDNYTLPQLYNFVANEKVDADTDLLLFCTDNVELTNDCISNLVNNWSEQCGTLGARLMLEDNTIQHIGYNIKKDNFTCYDVVQKQILPAEYRDTKINVYGNSNSFMLTSFALWKQLNGFDEKYKSNFFDIDYSIKALLNGKNSYNITGAVCWYHKAIKSKYAKRDENRISKRIKEYLTILDETTKKE